MNIHIFKSSKILNSPFWLKLVLASSNKLDHACFLRSYLDIVIESGILSLNSAAIVARVVVNIVL